MKKMIFAFSTLFALSSTAHLPEESQTPKPAFANLELLKAAKIPVLLADRDLGIGYTVLDSKMEKKLSIISHLMGHCAGYEALNEIPKDLNFVSNEFSNLSELKKKNQNYESLSPLHSTRVIDRSDVRKALEDLSPDRIKEFVLWLSSYPTRYNKSPEPNQHVRDMEAKLKRLIENAPYPVTVEQITHRSTPQNSIRLTIKGKTRPDEVIALGGHFDSINGWGGSGLAPGADDNASGSGSLFEALRVLLKQAQPERTIEFYWYAGEESGLLGSSEIAKKAKAKNKKIIAVLQLDMTMFPGSGESTIASINDFTSSWLRDYLRAANETYLKVKILDDECGYGCSDHASWYRNGFPTLMPTEAKFHSMFPDLHTTRDVVSDQMSFQHALIFSKIALILAMDLGNSTDRQPY